MTGGRALGLDILHDGGRAVRLLVQRCLILGLCLFGYSLPVSANWSHYTTGCTYERWDWEGCKALSEEWVQAQEEQGYAAYAVMLRDASGCAAYVYCGRWEGYRWIGDGDALKDCTSGLISCNALVVTPCNPPKFVDPDTGECRSPQEPEECYENGQIYDAEYGRCVLDCPNGQLNGVCLEDIGDNAEECNSDSADYKGYIGNGATRYNLCTSNMECEGGAFGLVNGTPACIPDEYGPPTCPSNGVVVIDEYGFVCESVSDAPAEPEISEEPNTDTDGDGEPDEYRRENDPESVDKGLDNVRDGISETNDKLDGSNQRLDKVVNALDAANDNLVEGLGTANETLNDISNKLDGPEGGYNTDGLGDAPTFEESAERLKTIISTNPTIQAVTTIPSIASNNTCPVWTIPATDYWSAMTMDSHCQILNDHRGLLSTIFIAVWTLAAVFVFLRA